LSERPGVCQGGSSMLAHRMAGALSTCRLVDGFQREPVCVGHVGEDLSPEGCPNPMSEAPRINPCSRLGGVGAPESVQGAPHLGRTPAPPSCHYTGSKHVVGATKRSRRVVPARLCGGRLGQYSPSATCSILLLQQCNRSGGLRRRDTLGYHDTSRCSLAVMRAMG